MNVLQPQLLLALAQEQEKTLELCPDEKLFVKREKICSCRLSTGPFGLGRGGYAIGIHAVVGVEFSSHGDCLMWE